MRKQHNAAVPMMEAIQTLNSYGLEVASGIILGLDSDTADTEPHLKEFVNRSQIPMLTMNLLQALPKTSLWDRLARDGRLVEDSGRESNVRFLRPYDEVVATWHRCIEHAYNPERLYARFTHQIEATYANRLVTPGGARLTRSNLKRGLTLFANLLIRVGVLADYRRPFWRMAWQAIKRGQFEALFGVGFISYHLIEFSREALRGQQNAAFYSARAREMIKLPTPAQRAPLSVRRVGRADVPRYTGALAPMAKLVDATDLKLSGSRGNALPDPVKVGESPGKTRGNAEPIRTA
jgi:hypothetical protein